MLKKEKKAKKKLERENKLAKDKEK